MDWDKLRIFHAVADAGSLTHAGETLNLSQSAVSRQMRGLEECVAVRWRRLAILGGAAVGHGREALSPGTRARASGERDGSGRTAARAGGGRRLRGGRGDGPSIG